MAAPKENYTADMVETIKRLYAEFGNDNARMAEIAAAVGKGERSVRAKLVREGVYVVPEKPVKVAKDEGPTKKELVAELLEHAPDFPVDGLMAANKDAIAAVIALAREATQAAE